MAEEQSGAVSAGSWDAKYVLAEGARITKPLGELLHHPLYQGYHLDTSRSKD